jgi:hypothetical protein
MGKTRKHREPVMKEVFIYKSEDYNNNNGMLTAIWGPSMWHYLHTMSFNYPTHPSRHDKVVYRNFILSLKNVLPCGKCRSNLKNNFKKLPLSMKDMENRHTFSLYIYRLHELINTMLHKKSGLTYENIRERYEHFRARCGKLPKTIKKKPEKGCTEPIYGKKSKCVLRIIPQEEKCETLMIA